MDISSTSSSLPNNDFSSVQRLGVAFVPWSGNLSDSNLRDPGFDECCGESGEQTFRKTYAFRWPSMHSYIVLKPDWYYEKCYKYVANPEMDSQPRSLGISDPVRRTNALDLYSLLNGKVSIRGLISWKEPTPYWKHMFEVRFRMTAARSDKKKSNRLT